MEVLILIFIGLFGALIGSFLNVCIIRLPKEESIVFPGSHCVHCNHALAWYDNIPWISFATLGGKCRYCKKKISWQYFIVETITAGLFILFYLFYGPTPKMGVFLVLSLALLVESVIDMRYQIIPDEITLPGIVIGVIVSVIFPVIHDEPSRAGALIQSVIGLLAGGGSLYLAGTIAEKIMKKEAMGGGDVKLLAMMGTVIGWQGVLWTIFVSSLIGSVVGVYFRFRKGDEVIPYGPFLALAGFLYLFFGGPVIAWYLRTVIG